MEKGLKILFATVILIFLGMWYFQREVPEAEAYGSQLVCDQFDCNIRVTRTKEDVSQAILEKRCGNDIDCYEALIAQKYGYNLSPYYNRYIHEPKRKKLSYELPLRPTTSRYRPLIGNYTVPIMYKTYFQENQYNQEIVDAWRQRAKRQWNDKNRRYMLPGRQYYQRFYY